MSIKMSTNWYLNKRRTPVALHLLTDAQIRNAAPGTYHDGRGLYLEVKSQTSAAWHLRYQIRGKTRKMGLGSYSKGISLRRARELAAEARALAAEGKDPLELRKASARQGLSLHDATQQFLKDVKAKSLKGGGEAGRWMSPLDNHALPKLGERGMADLTVDDVLGVLSPIWEVKYPTAKKVFNRLDQVFQYAGTFDDRVDPAMMARVKARLGSVKHKEISHAALRWQDAPALYRALSNSVTHLGLRFYMLTLPRTSNVTKATWTEINSRDAIWTIPDDRMKADVAFRAPLPWQAMDLLARMKARAGGVSEASYVFPSPTARKHGVISSNTWNKWFKEHDWATTAHGLRSTFRDWIEDNEICDARLAENCIQHETRGKVERAYQRSDKLELRRSVMEEWAKFVTGKTHHDLADAFEARKIERLRELHSEGKMLDVTYRDMIEERN